jgi:hypothetical protein
VVECQLPKLETCDTSPAKPNTSKPAQVTPSSSPSSQEQNDPDLTVVIDAWPTLSDAIKAGIMAMVKAQPS